MVYSSILIMIFLKKNLTNICGEISKIGMNLWMVYICDIKSYGKYNTKRWEEGECTLYYWPKSSEICECSRPFQEFERHLVDGGRNGEIFIQEESIIIQNWNKGKSNTKDVSKITTCIRWTRALSTISNRQNQSSASLKLRN